MKHQIFLFVLILSFSLTAQLSQPFGKNATWTVAFENEFGYRGFRQISYSHDSIINGEAWQKFSVSGVQELRTGPNPNDIAQWRFSGIDFGILYLTRNDSVFRMDEDGNVNLSFDYNAQIGDRWQIAPWDTSLSCVDTPFVKVVNTGTEILNGKALKFWDVEDPMDTIMPFGSSWYGCSAGSCMGGRVYSRIGAAYASLSSFRNYYNFEPNQNICGMPLQLPSYYLRCYEDDSVSINLIGGQCDKWNFISIEESTLKYDFNIFPNPNGSGLLNIESLNAFDAIVVRDISGKVHFSGSYSSILKTELIIDLKAGLYFIQLKNNHKNLGVHKLVIQ